jgi:hypothetical protein
MRTPKMPFKAFGVTGSLVDRFGFSRLSELILIILKGGAAKEIGRAHV